MKRRSSAVTGWVNFPLADPGWKNSNEGGMLVKLVVCDNRDCDHQFGLCSGSGVTDILSESFIADDRRPRPTPPAHYDSIEAVNAEREANCAWEAYHFPDLHNEGATDVGRYLSRRYLAALVIGTTGWSGWHEGDGRYWQCTFEDLTEEGRGLYRQIQALYDGCEVHLLTFLDT